MHYPWPLCTPNSRQVCRPTLPRNGFLNFEYAVLTVLLTPLAGDSLVVGSIKVKIEVMWM